jgi:hypothetical protein
MTNSNRTNNSIDSLIIDGTVSTDKPMINEYIVQFYNILYNEQFSWWLKLDDLYFDSIGEVEANWLERAIEEGEVLEVVKAMNSDKVPGP